MGCSMNHYGFDPGNMTGVAISDETGKLVAYEQISFENLFTYLSEIKEAKVFVIEEFLIRPGINFSWNDMKVIQAIGSIRYCAYQLGAAVVMQSPTIKSIGYKWAGIKTSKDHSFSHQLDAWAHLTYFNHKKLGLPIPAMRKMQDEARKA
jgi:hypothetical protein